MALDGRTSVLDDLKEALIADGAMTREGSMRNPDVEALLNLGADAPSIDPSEGNPFAQNADNQATQHKARSDVDSGAGSAHSSGSIMTSSSQEKKKLKEKQTAKRRMADAVMVTQLSEPLLGQIDDFNEGLFEHLFNALEGDPSKAANMTAEEYRIIAMKQNPEGFKEIVSNIQKEKPNLSYNEAEGVAADLGLADFQEKMAALNNRLDAEQGFQNKILSGMSGGAAAQIRVDTVRAAIEAGDDTLQSQLDSLTQRPDPEALRSKLMQKIDEFAELSDERDELSEKLEEMKLNTELRTLAPDFIPNMENQLAEIDAKLEQQQQAIEINNGLIFFMESEDVANLSFEEMVYAFQKPEYADTLKAMEKLYGAEAINQAFMAAAEQQGLNAEQISRYANIMKTIGSATEELANMREGFDDENNPVLQTGDIGVGAGAYIFANEDGSYKLVSTTYIIAKRTVDITDPETIAKIEEAAANGARIGTAEEAATYIKAGNELTGAQIAETEVKIEQSSEKLAVAKADDAKGNYSFAAAGHQADIERLEEKVEKLKDCIDENSETETSSPAPKPNEEQLLTNSPKMQEFMNALVSQHGIPEAELRAQLEKRFGVAPAEMDQTMAKLTKQYPDVNISPLMNTQIATNGTLSANRAPGDLLTGTFAANAAPPTTEPTTDVALDLTVKNEPVVQPISAGA